MDATAPRVDSKTADILPSLSNPRSSASATTRGITDDLSLLPANTVKARKKRKKHSSTVQKEELARLKAELEQLQYQHSQLQNETIKTNAERQNAALAEVIHKQRVCFALGHSMLSQFMRVHEHESFLPLIQLGSNPTNRFETLRAMKHQKLRHARECLEAQMSYMDESNAFSESQKFLDQHNDRCFRLFDVTILPLHQETVKSIFDEMCRFVSSFEMKFSETQGDFTIRDIDNTQDPSVSQHRIVTFVDKHAAIESNHITFTEFLPPKTNHEQGDVGIIASQFVDDDALYPYWPDKFLRQDVTMFAMVRHGKQCRKFAQGVFGDRWTAEDKTVTIIRSTLSRVRRSALPLTCDELQRLHEGIQKVDAAMIDQLRTFIRSREHAFSTQ